MDIFWKIIKIELFLLELNLVEIYDKIVLRNSDYGGKYFKYGIYFKKYVCRYTIF